VSALALRGIVKRLTGPSAPVLDGLDLVVEPGRTVGIAGANGAGKTTLLRVTAGLLRPDAGRVTLGELDPERTPRPYHRRVALLSADGGLYARLTVTRHLQWWAAMSYLPREERDDRVRAVLADFELSELAGRRVERLSAGQRQRVRLAMAFLPRPELVLLDEPDARLDEDGLALLSARMAEHAQRDGLTVWAAPEGRTELLPCDELRLLSEGRLT
jgi:ABC-2 type transport system ATP-binding protein